MDLKEKIFMYVDDSALLYSSASFGMSIIDAELDQEKLLRFFASIKLSLNSDKKKFIHFSAKDNGSVLEFLAPIKTHSVSNF